MKVSIILPTYNESGNIVNLINSISHQSDLKNYQLEFIVVDDNSPDETAKQVKNMVNPKVKLFVRKDKRGLATAILHGIKKSTGQIIVLMDTDFNHKPEDVPRLLKPIINGQADLAIGSRYIPGGGMSITEANKVQFFLSKNGNFFVNKILLNLPFHESLSGFLAFKRSILTKLNLATIFQGYGDYCISLLYRTYKQGFIITEIPVIYGKRQWGQSKTKLIKIFIDYLITSLKLRFSQV